MMSCLDYKPLLDKIYADVRTIDGATEFASTAVATFKNTINFSRTASQRRPSHPSQLAAVALRNCRSICQAETPFLLSSHKIAFSDMVKAVVWLQTNPGSLSRFPLFPALWISTVYHMNAFRYCRSSNLTSKWASSNPLRRATHVHISARFLALASAWR